MADLRRIASLRAQNIEKSIAAGVPVGARSELEMRIAPGIRRKRTIKTTRFKPDASVKPKSKLRRKKRRVEFPGSKWDLMNRWRRLPGSFENGKRR